MLLRRLNLVAKSVRSLSAVRTIRCTARASMRAPAAAITTAAPASSTDEKRNANREQRRASGARSGAGARKLFSATAVLATAAAAGVGSAVALSGLSGSDEQSSRSASEVLACFDTFEEAVRLQIGADGRTKDVPKAYELFLKAAEDGSAPAQYNLGQLLLYGTAESGVTRDDKAAAKWFHRAASQEDAEAQFFLGLLYSIGRGVEGGQNGAKAMEWWQRAADQNFAPAQLRLASAYKPTDPNAPPPPPPPAAADPSASAPFSLPDSSRSAGKSLYWLLRAARSGLPDAIHALQKYGDSLGAAAGWTIATFDQTKHTALLFGDEQSTSASPSTELHRWYQLGLMYRLSEPNSDSQSHAVSYLRKAADGGYSLAQCELAAAYSLQLISDVTKPDATAAERAAAADGSATVWFTRAASQGLPVAMYNLGARAYAAGKHKDAAQWFIRAAVRGDPQAQNNLGALFCRGIGVDAADEEAGVRWFAYAARRGMPEAMHALGQAYELGVGVDADADSAAYWYGEAASRGIKQAEASLKLLRQSGQLSSAVGQPQTKPNA